MGSGFFWCVGGKVLALAIRVVGFFYHQQVEGLGFVLSGWGQGEPYWSFDTAWVSGEARSAFSGSAVVDG